MFYLLSLTTKKNFSPYPFPKVKFSFFFLVKVWFRVYIFIKHMSANTHVICIGKCTLRAKSIITKGFNL